MNEESKRKGDADNRDGVNTAIASLSAATNKQLKQLIQQVQSLQISQDDIALFFHTVIDSFIGHAANFSIFSSSLTQQIQSFTSLITLLISVSSSATTAANILAAIASSDSASSSWVPILQSCLRARYGECRSAALTHTVAITPTFLQDYDWNVRIIMSSETLAQVKTPVCLLSLTLKGQTDQQHITPTGSEIDDTHTITVELSISQLDRLLEHCAQIQKVLQTCQP